MACTWLVCGAGRGVGKTRVARGLEARLPDAVYAKHGHGVSREDKPGRLLHSLSEVERFRAARAHHRHVIIESNSLVIHGGGDVVVFVEGQPRGLPRRDDADALRAAADLIIDHDQPVQRWRTLLTERLGDGPVAEAVLELFFEQVVHLPAPKLTAGTKLWLRLPGEHGMGGGLVQLLVGIDRHATLRMAARDAGISYRHAWDLIRTAEQHLGTPLIVSRPGGAGGGGTSLTALGFHLVRCFQTLDRDLEDFANRRLAALLAGEEPK